MKSSAEIRHCNSGLGDRRTHREHEYNVNKYDRNDETKEKRSRRRIKSWVLIKWRILKFRSKVISILLAILFLQHAAFWIWDQWYCEIGDIDGYIGSSSSSSSSHENSVTAETSSSFSVVINTYKRPLMLRDAVQHYAETCGKRYRVSQVFVVWADQELEPPDSGSFFSISDNADKLRGDKNEIVIQQQQLTGSSNRATVEVLKKSKDSLNSRFEPISQLQTNSVFMVDDDVRVSCPSLLLGFQSWALRRELPDQSWLTPRRIDKKSYDKKSRVSISNFLSIFW